MLYVIYKVTCYIIALYSFAEELYLFKLQRSRTLIKRSIAFNLVQFYPRAQKNIINVAIYS